MGLTNDERSSLVELRLEKAKRFIAEAEQMLSMGLWDLAANRFYYSCFHAAQATINTLWAFGTYSCWYFRRIWYEFR